MQKFKNCSFSKDEVFLGQNKLILHLLLLGADNIGDPMKLKLIGRQTKLVLRIENEIIE